MPEFRYPLIADITCISGLPAEASEDDHCHAVAEDRMVQLYEAEARRLGLVYGNPLWVAKVSRRDFERIRNRNRLPDDLAKQVRAMMQGTLYATADVLVMDRERFTIWHLRVDAQGQTVNQKTHMVREG